MSSKIQCSCVRQGGDGEARFKVCDDCLAILNIIGEDWQEGKKANHYIKLEGEIHQLFIEKIQDERPCGRRFAFTCRVVYFYLYPEGAWEKRSHRCLDISSFRKFIWENKYDPPDFQI